MQPAHGCHSTKQVDVRCPKLHDLPSPPTGLCGWPWTEASSPLPEHRKSGGVWPKVSLVVPSYNQGRFIEESIRAALLQGYPDLELVIIDGKSNDQTLEVIMKYEPWIARWVSESDRGQSDAINKGLAMCTGKYFNWNNSDDVLTKGSLERIVDALEDHPEAGGATGYVNIIDGNSKIVSVNDGRSNLQGRSGFLHDAECCISMLKSGCQPGGLFLRELVCQIGGIDNNIHYAMDVDLQLRIMCHRPIYHVDFPVISFRLHAESKTSGHVQGRALERLKMADKLFNDGLVPPSMNKQKSAAFVSAHHSASECFRQSGHFMRCLWHRYLMGCWLLKARMQGATIYR